MKSLSEIWISNSGELVQNKIIILQLTTQPIYILTLISSPQALTITTDQTADTVVHIGAILQMQCQIKPVNLQTDVKYASQNNWFGGIHLLARQHNISLFWLSKVAQHNIAQHPEYHQEKQ